MKNRINLFTLFCLSWLLFFSASAWGQDSYEPDSYEPDSSSKEAKKIILNDEKLQEHTLHNAQDEDWVKFYALSGQSYRIEANGPEEDCDIVLQLYNTDGDNLEENGDHGFNGENEHLEWSCPENEGGVYYVKVSFSTKTSGDNTGYALRAFRPQAADSVWIQGTVTDASGTPLKEVRLKTSGHGSDLSGDNGEYSILEQPGDYDLIAEADGYSETVSIPVKLTNEDGLQKNIIMYWCDINGDKAVNLEDAILAVRVAAGKSTSQTIYAHADTDGDDQIGLAEAMCALRKVAGIE